MNDLKEVADIVWDIRYGAQSSAKREYLDPYYPELLHGVKCTETTKVSDGIEIANRSRDSTSFLHFTTSFSTENGALTNVFDSLIGYLNGIIGVFPHRLILSDGFGDLVDRPDIVISPIQNVDNLTLLSWFKPPFYGASGRFICVTKYPIQEVTALACYAMIQTRVNEFRVYRAGTPTTLGEGELLREYFIFEFTTYQARDMAVEIVRSRLYLPRYGDGNQIISLGSFKDIQPSIVDFFAENSDITDKAHGSSTVVINEEYYPITQNTGESSSSTTPSPDYETKAQRHTGSIDAVALMFTAEMSKTLQVATSTPHISVPGDDSPEIYVNPYTIEQNTQPPSALSPTDTKKKTTGQVINFRELDKEMTIDLFELGDVLKNTRYPITLGRFPSPNHCLVFYSLLMKRLALMEHELYNQDAFKINIGKFVDAGNLALLPSSLHPGNGSDVFITAFHSAVRTPKTSDNIRLPFYISKDLTLTQLLAGTRVSGSFLLVIAARDELESALIPVAVGLIGETEFIDLPRNITDMFATVNSMEHIIPQLRSRDMDLRVGDIDYVPGQESQVTPTELIEETNKRHKELRNTIFPQPGRFKVFVFDSARRYHWFGPMQETLLADYGETEVMSADAKTPVSLTPTADGAEGNPSDDQEAAAGGSSAIERLKKAGGASLLSLLVPGRGRVDVSRLLDDERSMKQNDQVQQSESQEKQSTPQGAEPVEEMVADEEQGVKQEAMDIDDKESKSEVVPPSSDNTASPTPGVKQETLSDDIEQEERTGSESESSDTEEMKTEQEQKSPVEKLKELIAEERSDDEQTSMWTLPFTPEEKRAAKALVRIQGKRIIMGHPLLTNGDTINGVTRLVRSPKLRHPLKLRFPKYFHMFHRRGEVPNYKMIDDLPKSLIKSSEQYDSTNSFSSYNFSLVSPSPQIRRYYAEYNPEDSVQNDVGNSLEQRSTLAAPLHECSKVINSIHQLRTDRCESATIAAISRLRESVAYSLKVLEHSADTSFLLSLNFLFSSESLNREKFPEELQAPTPSRTRRHSNFKASRTSATAAIPTPPFSATTTPMSSPSDGSVVGSAARDQDDAQSELLPEIMKQRQQRQLMSLLSTLQTVIVNGFVQRLERSTTGIDVKLHWEGERHKENVAKFVQNINEMGLNIKPTSELLLLVCGILVGEKHTLWIVTVVNALKTRNMNTNSFMEGLPEEIKSVLLKVTVKREQRGDGFSISKAIHQLYEFVPSEKNSSSVSMSNTWEPLHNLITLDTKNQHKALFSERDVLSKYKERSDAGGHGDKTQMRRLKDCMAVPLRSYIHGFGLFCGEPCEDKTRVSKYIGRSIGNLMSDRLEEAYIRNGQQSIYMFRNGVDSVIDATYAGNIGRFTNHSCAPNCRASVHKTEIHLTSTRKIHIGEEFTFDYGFKNLSADGFDTEDIVMYGSSVTEKGNKQIESDTNYFKRFNRKIACMCGSSKCRGFID